MSQRIRTLFVYAQDRDVEYIVNALRRGGYEPAASRVDTRPQLRKAIQSEKWDLIISDFALPHIDGLTALALTRQKGRAAPFFLVCDSLGEETAVAAIKAGVADYITRNNIERLVPAVNRELRDAVEQHKREGIERELLRRDEQLRLALTAARMSTWEWDVATGQLTWSEQAEAIFGPDGDDFPYTRAKYLDLIPIGDRALVEQAATDALRDGRDFELAHRIVGPDGSMRWLGTKGRVYHDANGNPVRVAGTAADITDRKEAEAALHTSEVRYRDLYEEAPVAMYTVDIQGNITRANHRAAELLGYPIPDLLGHSVFSLYAHHPVASERTKRLVEQFLSSQPVEDVEIELQRPGKERWWGSLSTKPIFDDAGNVVGSRSMLVDVTVRKRAEELLQLSQRAIDGSPDLIGICDANYIFGRVNRAYSNAYERSQDEIVGMSVGAVMSKTTFDRAVKPYVDRCLAGEDVSFESWFDTPSAGRRLYSVAYSPLRAAKGRVEGVIMIARDITERQRALEERNALEAQLRQAQKMEALGTLAGGIAHDFNNLLLAIVGYTELTRDDLPEGSALRRNLDQVLTASERAQVLVKQILAFGRRADNVFAMIDAKTSVREALSFLRATLPATIEVRESFDPKSCLIMADETQVHQMIVNLGSNAMQAMRDSGGVITVTVKRAEVTQSHADRLGGIAPGPYVRVAVEDTGPGMPPEIVERIYDPFFTTKGPGEGTGLGLSVVHGIVLSHGGGLGLQTRPGEGACFEIFLPRSTQEAPTPQPDEDPSEGGSERILFIDDEEQLAELGQQVLERLGYTVTAVTSAERALARYANEPRAFDVVITDQTMPSCTGLELARQIRRISESVPIILTTGFSEAVTPETLSAERIDVLVMKPYSGHKLARAIREALRRAATDVDAASGSEWIFSNNTM